MLYPDGSEAYAKALEGVRKWSITSTYYLIKKKKGEKKRERGGARADVKTKMMEEPAEKGLSPRACSPKMKRSPSELDLDTAEAAFKRMRVSPEAEIRCESEESLRSFCSTVSGGSKCGSDCPRCGGVNELTNVKQGFGDGSSESSSSGWSAASTREPKPEKLSFSEKLLNKYERLSYPANLSKSTTKVYWDAKPEPARVRFSPDGLSEISAMGPAGSPDSVRFVTDLTEPESRVLTRARDVGFPTWNGRQLFSPPYKTTRAEVGAEVE